MFWIRKIKPQQPQDVVGYDFDFVMGRVERMLKELDDPQQKIALVDYFIEAIKKDAVGSGLYEIARLARKSSSFSSYRSLFPFSYVSKNCPVVKIDFASTDIFSAPYDDDKFIRAISDIERESFCERKNAFDIYYLSEINLALVVNGRHHAAVAAAKRKGSVSAYKVTLADYLPLYKVKNGKWWSKAENKYIEKINFRGALLFELFRVRYELENSR